MDIGEIGVLIIGLGFLALALVMAYYEIKEYLAGE